MDFRLIKGHSQYRGCRAINRHLPPLYRIPLTYLTTKPSNPNQAIALLKHSFELAAGRDLKHKK